MDNETKCGSCGKAAAELNPCVWDTQLMVGACCENYTEARCPDCGSDKLRYTGGEPNPHRYAATCEDCGFHTDDGEGDLLNVVIGPAHPLQPQLPLAPGCAPRPARKEVATVPAMISRMPATAAGIASIGPGLYVRTAPRRKGGRR